MELNVLWVIGIAIAVVALYFAFFKSKEKWEFSDVIFILGLDAMDDIIPFARIVAEQMGLPKDDAERYSKIAADTLAYLRSLPSDDKEEIIAAGIQYATELCMEFNIEVDEDMQRVIEFTVKAAHFLIDYIDKNKVEDMVALEGKVKVINVKNE